MIQKETIRLMTDTCSDIPKDLAEELGIVMLCFPVTVDGVSYREVADFSKEAFYDMIENAQEYPTTAQLTPFEWQEAFAQQAKAGCTDLIVVTIGSQGSATYRNACMARAQFAEDNAGEAHPMRIHLVDGRNYTATYGYAVVEAAKMRRRGACVAEMLDYLNDWMASAALYFVPLTLKYVKRSGRVRAAAAFAGELLGLRPLCEIIDCKSNVLTKIRGEQHVVSKLVELAKERMIPHTSYVVMRGVDERYAKELAAALTKQLGYPPAATWSIGATVACNAGPSVVGLILRQPKREAMLAEE